MDDLVTWLQQQIDEDENAVRAMIGKGPTDAFLTRHRVIQTLIVETDSSTEAARFRLAECDSKRALIRVLAKQSNRDDEAWGYQMEAQEMIKIMALPYADRPGYREDWRP